MARQIGRLADTKLALKSQISITASNWAEWAPGKYSNFGFWMRSLSSAPRNAPVTHVVPKILDKNCKAVQSICIWTFVSGPFLVPMNHFLYGKVTPHPLGYFHTHDRQRGGGRIRPHPCYLVNQWSYRAPRGGVRKLSTRCFQNILKILRLTLSIGLRSGQRSYFDFSVWRSLGPALSTVFARIIQPK